MRKNVILTTAHYIIIYIKTIHVILETKGFVESILLISSVALQFLKISLDFSQRTAKITRQAERWFLKRTTSPLE